MTTDRDFDRIAMAWRHGSGGRRACLRRGIIRA